MLRSLILSSTLLLSCAGLHAATVYKYVDENGNTVFTDEPRKGAEVLDIQPVPTIPAIPIPQPAPIATPQADFQYSKIELVAPKDQANIINEVEPIVVQVALSPALRPGDRAQLLLNGAPKGGPQSTTSFTLEGLERGEYQAIVKIVGKKGQELGTSNNVTFHVKRNSKLMPKPAKPTPVTKAKK